MTEAARMSERADRTRVEMVMDGVRARIAARLSPPGSRLPSLRAHAVATGVSKSTVVEAYDRLAAEGLIMARPGSGFFVSGRAAAPQLAETAPQLDREIDPLWISRQSLQAPDGALKPGCGWVPASWMPDTLLRKALRALARGGATALSDYDGPLGHGGLRHVLARRMAERGVAAAPDQILLTDSGTQALDLVCRLLLQPGDAVIVDDPCYFNFHALLRAHGAVAVGAPMTPTGPDVEAFAAALAEKRPRLYLTNSGLHNPTGATLSPLVAHRVLKLCEDAGTVIVEDDIFADFDIEGAPRLAALDGLERVVQIGSFSKTLSAAARCGFVAARGPWIEALADLKIATSFSGARLAAELVHAATTDAGYRRHMEQVRRKLARAMEETIRALTRLGVQPWIEPRGGMFLWCSLPDGLESADIARRCLAQGVILAPGDAFSLSRSAGSHLRFNVAQCGDPRIFVTLEQAMKAARDVRAPL